MKAVNFLLVIVFAIVISNIALGARQLEEMEVVQILQEITKQPKRTWMPAGTIEAVCEEYKAAKTTDLNEINAQTSQKIKEYQNDLDSTTSSEKIQKMKLDAIPFNTRYRLSNEYTMTSATTMKYDGDRFYKEINVNSRTDSVKPDKKLADNFMTDDFNLQWNGKRVFAWDGQNYTTYSSGNNAIIDSKSNPPKLIDDPFTAGLVPWGYGVYTYDSLINAEVTATEDIVDGQIQIVLTLNNLNGIFMTIALDKEKNYALISHTMLIEETVFTTNYDNYTSVNGSWVPTSILVEKTNVNTNKLLERDLWSFNSIDGNTPAVDSFEVKLDDDTIVKYASDITDNPVTYHNSLNADTDGLLAERLTYVANEGSQKQNCATIALKYTLGQLGKEVTDSQLAELVADSTGDTSLLEMKQFAQSLGLYCQAVTTDLDTLKDLENCQVILHIPGRNHFVVLESIDDKYVRVIDLANNKFYYRTDINFFSMDWTQGVALIISSNNVTGDFTNINDDELIGITGASGYSCTRVVQEESSVDLCTKMAGICDGFSADFYELKGCEASESGSCSTESTLRAAVLPCINDLCDPDICTWTTAIYYYTQACQ